MPNRAKAEEDIKRRMTEIQDIVDTCNLTPTRKEEYRKELKKLNELLSKHRERKGFTLLEGMIAIAIVAIIIAIFLGGLKDEEKKKELLAVTGEIEKVEYLSGESAKTVIYWKNGTTTVMDGHVSNPVPKGTRARITYDSGTLKYKLVPEGPFPAEVPR